MRQERLDAALKALADFLYVEDEVADHGELYLATWQKHNLGQYNTEEAIRVMRKRAIWALNVARGEKEQGE